MVLYCWWATPQVTSSTRKFVAVTHSQKNSPFHFPRAKLLHATLPNIYCVVEMLCIIFFQHIDFSKQRMYTLKGVSNLSCISFKSQQCGRLWDSTTCSISSIFIWPSQNTCIFAILILGKRRFKHIWVHGLQNNLLHVKASVLVKCLSCMGQENQEYTNTTLHVRPPNKRTTMIILKFGMKTAAWLEFMAPRSP